jgi:NAD+ synthase (glutamine-hydrolysing)
MRTWILPCLKSFNAEKFGNCPVRLERGIANVAENLIATPKRGRFMKIAMAQINPTTGDLHGNAAKICDAVRAARRRNCDLIVVPETAITGYMSCDLLEIDDFVETNRRLLHDVVVPECRDIAAVVGYVETVDSAGCGSKLRNAAAVVQNGAITAVAHKRNLCRYRYYDETRYFSPGEKTTVAKLQIGGKQRRVGILICEDLWDENYPATPYRDAAEAGAELIVVINASPFDIGKWQRRIDLIRQHQATQRLAVIYTNTTAIGDNLKDIILFDGRSMIVDSAGDQTAGAPLFQENLCIAELDGQMRGTKTAPSNWTEEEEIYYALTFALREYCRQTGFEKALLGISGGIDSAVCAALAADTLGPKNILGVSLPSRHSSAQTREDVAVLCRKLGIERVEIPIHSLHAETIRVLNRHRTVQRGVTDENIQARLRGLLLMGVSNDDNRMVIATGNKTELGLGYCTLYGDMVGGILLIGDINKMQVYRLADYLNRRGSHAIIPQSILSRKPSAELAQDQEDPFDYTVVAPLVDDLIARMSPMEIMMRYRDGGLDARYPEDVHVRYPAQRFKALLTDTYQRYRSAAFKRSQSCPTVIVSPRALGFDLRETIINHWQPEW